MRDVPMPLPNPTYEAALLAAPESREKSVRVALLLAVLGGPLGLFYTNSAWAWALTFAAIVAGLFTVGIAAILLWIVAIVLSVPLALATRDPAHGAHESSG